MRVVWSEPSEFDLDDLYDYIAKESPIYAEQFIDQILKEVGALAHSPRIGRIVPEAGSDVIRERIVQSQRVIYFIDDKKEIMYILALVHVRRNLQSDEDKPWD